VTPKVLGACGNASWSSSPGSPRRPRAWPPRRVSLSSRSHSRAGQRARSARPAGDPPRVHGGTERRAHGPARGPAGRLSCSFL